MSPKLEKIIVTISLAFLLGSLNLWAFSLLNTQQVEGEEIFIKNMLITKKKLSEEFNETSNDLLIRSGGDPKNSPQYEKEYKRRINNYRAAYAFRQINHNYDYNNFKANIIDVTNQMKTWGNLYDKVGMQLHQEVNRLNNQNKR